MGRAIDLPDFIHPGATVRVMDWVGVVLSTQGSLVTLESPKRVVRQQTSLDVLDYSLAPQLWQPATIEDLIADADAQRKELARAKRQRSRRQVQDNTFHPSRKG